MADILADVIRVFDTQANVLAALREKMVGYATNSDKLIAKKPGGTFKYFVPEGGSPQFNLVEVGKVEAIDDTTTYLLLEDGGLQLSADGNLLLRFGGVISGEAAFMEFNPGQFDQDFIVNYLNHEAWKVNGATGVTTFYMNFDVLGVAVTPFSTMTCHSDTPAHGADIRFRKNATDDPEAIQKVGTDDVLGRLIFYGMDNFNVFSSAAVIEAVATDTTAGDSIPSKLVFSTSDNATYPQPSLILKPSKAELQGDLIFVKTAGKGIKIDPTSPAFGWKDLLGNIVAKNTGATAPALATYRGGLQQFQFAVNDECFLEFHLPHDYVPGTDIFIHAHWSHISAAVTTGVATWGFETSYAKGYDQAAFIAPVSPTVAQNASTVQYRHMIAEVQLSAASPSGSQIDSDDLQPDGLILVRAYLSANTLSAAADPFLHFVDIHYQSTQLATKNKAYPFYT